MIVDTTLMRSGFCDRLRQITFGILISKFKKEKMFYINEKNKSHRCSPKHQPYSQVTKAH